MGEGRSMVLVSRDINDAAVAMICVLAKAHVGNDQEVRTRGFYGADCTWDNAIRGIVFASTRIFVLRNTEQNNSRNAARSEVTRF